MFKGKPLQGGKVVEEFGSVKDVWTKMGPVLMISDEVVVADGFCREGDDSAKKCFCERKLDA